MDKLSSQEGYTLVETLLGIIILGLVITFFAMFFSQTFKNPKILLKGDALLLAEQEMNFCTSHKIISDTTYFNTQGNLSVSRKVVLEGNIYKAEITVAADSGKKEILSLSGLYSK